MYDPWLVIALVCSYIGFLFLIALWVERGSSWARRLAHSPVVYSLALAVYCTSWTFFGSVGKAATSGMLFLTIYLGPTLAIILWWFVLRKLVRIKTTHRVTSIADFISARYGRSQPLAALATLIALVGTMPYIALQLKAVTSTFTLITVSGGTTGSWIGSNVGLIVVALMVLFTIIFGVRRLDPTERHEGMVTALAIECLVKLIAFLAAGVFVTYFLYDGFDDILQRLSESPFSNLLHIAGTDVSSYITWMSYLILAMSAIQFLPRQFHVAVVENSNEKNIRTAMWLFPLYMLLINIFVVPIAAGGLLQGYPTQEADTFVLGLPLRHGQPWLALFVFIGGFSAATGMIIVNSMTMSTMITNHLLLPLVERVRRLGFLRRHLLRARWVAVALILLIGYWFERGIGESYTLVNMGMISFAAVLQFAPAILGGLFWRRGNKTGALLGLSAGFLTWAYTLLIPSFARSGWLPSSFIENGPWGIQFLKPEQLFGLTGMAAIPHTVFWSLLFNVGLYILGSLYTEESEAERRLVETFVGALAADVPARPLAAGESYIDLAGKVRMIEDLLSRYFGPATVAATVERCLDTVGIGEQSQITVAELAELQSEVEKSLAGSIGAAAAHHAVRQIELFTPLEAGELSEVYGGILVRLGVSPEELRRRIDYYRERESLLADQAAELEEKAAERARALETAAEVARAAASILDPDRLIQQAVELIRERFDLYYVGLFLLDEVGEWAVLRAGTGEAGQTMLARGHRIRVGEGMIGWSVAHAKARVALEAGKDAARLATAELPDTRSEAALPLRSRGQTIGALTVQSDRVGAFDEDTIVALQTMADQLAVALDNARLFAEAQTALEAERRAYGEISRQAWTQEAHSRAYWGYRCSADGVSSSTGDWQPEMEQALRNAHTVVVNDDTTPTIAVPIRVRGNIIGVLNFRKADANDTWSPEETTLLETLTEQLGNALESARLYRETRRRAARERLTREITDKMRRAAGIDDLMQTTIREMSAVLGTTGAFIQLSEPTGSSGDERDGKLAGE